MAIPVDTHPKHILKHIYKHILKHEHKKARSAVNSRTVPVSYINETMLILHLLCFPILLR